MDGKCVVVVKEYLKSKGVDVVIKVKIELKVVFELNMKEYKDEDDDELK